QRLEVADLVINRLHLIVQGGELFRLGGILGAIAFKGLVGDLFHPANTRGAGGFQVGELLAGGLNGHFIFLGVTFTDTGSRRTFLSISETGPRFCPVVTAAGADSSRVMPAEASAAWSADLIAVMTASAFAG